jgi:hypothetical protein
MLLLPWLSGLQISGIMLFHRMLPELSALIIHSTGLPVAGVEQKSVCIA